jgi:hypothetical protein
VPGRGENDVRCAHHAGAAAVGNGGDGQAAAGDSGGGTAGRFCETL